ncbi:MAG: hypothetical protein IKU27_08160 [Clostridia bacterium]|nr:hypothetical protein [Clostridia bacterium]
MRKKIYLAPLCTLACILTMAALSPALARWKEELPVMAPISVSAGMGETVRFSADDFKATGDELSGIVVQSLPTGGILTRGGETLTEGSVIPTASLGTLSFIPNDPQVDLLTHFSVRPIFADKGAAQDTVAVSIDLSDRPNSTPIAQNMTLETCCGLPLAGQLSAIDPDGDEMAYELTAQPRYGSVTLEDGRFIYTPTGSKARADAFTFTAIDPRGARSESAAVVIDVREAQSGLTYADMENDPNHYAAVRLAELGILRGEQIGDNHFLSPDAAVSRAQFVAMAARLLELPLPTAAVSTGAADNVDVPVWARASMAAALTDNLIEGEQQNGNRVLRAADPITMAETAVILDRMLCLQDDGRTVDYAAAVPTWAAQAVVNTVEGGYLPLADGSFDPSAPLTRSEAAACLYRVYKALHTEDSFWDIF